MSEGPRIVELEDGLERPEGWSRGALILIAKINLFAQGKWDRVSNGSVCYGQPPLLWARILKTGNGFKEDGAENKGG